MPARLLGVRRFILCRVQGLQVCLEVTHCIWCTDTAVCSACDRTADRIRTSLARTAAKRDARLYSTQSGGHNNKSYVPMQ